MDLEPRNSPFYYVVCVTSMQWVSSDAIWTCYYLSVGFVAVQKYIPVPVDDENDEDSTSDGIGEHGTTW